MANSLTKLRPQQRAGAAERLTQLHDDLEGAHAEIQELRDCLRAALDGDLSLAETYLAGGALGLRRDAGDAALSFAARGLRPRGRCQIAASPQQLFSLRRLYIEPELAPRFGLVSLMIGNHYVMGPFPADAPLPCGMFDDRHRSPLIDRVVEIGNQVRLEIVNFTDETQDFRMAALGYVGAGGRV